MSLIPPIQYICKPSSFMSSSTQSFQVFLFLLLHLTPATSTYLQADTQSSTLLRPRCQNTSICHASPHLPHSAHPTNLHYVSYPSATPHTSILPSSPDYTDMLSSSPRFQSHISIHSGVWTQALYIFPFMQYDAPGAVRIGDNSLNLTQAHLTLALAASSTPL